MIIFDLDGTLADCEHRRHFVDAEKNFNLSFVQPGNINSPPWGWYTQSGERWKPDYKSFYEACHKDNLIFPTAELFSRICYEEDYGYSLDYVNVWSGRCESVRKKTEKWLNYFFPEIPEKYWEQGLKMRPIGDSTPDDVLKEKWLDDTIIETKWGNKIPIDFVFDSDPDCIKMWRRRGVFVFNCQQDGEF